MKFKSFFVLSALSLLLLTACEQEPNDPIDYYFCTTSTSGDASWTLYIDGDLAGPLPYVSAVPNCNNTAALSGLLHLSLSEERHHYEAKDAQGAVRSDGYFKFELNHAGQQGKTDCYKGGFTADWTCDHIVMSMFD